MITTKVRATLLATLTVGALTLGACGGSSSGSSDDTSAPPETATATVPSGSGSSTTSAGTTDATYVAGSTLFVDPQGEYTIEISPDWPVASGAVAADIEAWQIGISTDQFSDNVNVLSQSTGGLDLQAYLDRSAQTLGGMELIESKVVTGPAGNELGVFEYSGTLPSAPIPLHALATVAVKDGQAQVATLTTTLETFDQARAIAEEYLMTLQAT